MSEARETETKTEITPRPTFAPAAMALGIMMLLWGITTMWIMSLGGFGVMAWALWMWINEIRQEWLEETASE